MAGRGRIRRYNSQDTSVPKKNKPALGLRRNGTNNMDARLKIIQKNRLKLVDARDKLAQMAKKTDARSKILKLRQVRQDHGASNGESIRPLGNGIMVKTDRFGKISLSTNKPKRSSAPADMNSAIRKELGLDKHRSKMVSSQSPLTRHIQNKIPTPYRKPYPPKELTMSNVYISSPALIKRTIQNDIRELPPLPDFSHSRVDSNLYTWVRPSPRHSLPMSAMDHKHTVKVTARNNLAIEHEPDWSYANPSLRSIKISSAHMDIDDDDEISSVRSPVHHKTNVHSRLDTPPTAAISQGIFGQGKEKVLMPLGHRIVVSNLQATVTQDDIRELFEDVGELLVSRLVRPGTAEVIYKNLKDAQKAVDTYHNRQLDGQPMKCLLVNKRPVNNPTAPAVRPSKSSSSVLRTSGGITKKSATSVKASAKLVPDLSTIHKVLFHKS